MNSVKNYNDGSTEYGLPKPLFEEIDDGIKVAILEK